jgi:Tol biopolymer transport system component
MNKQAIILWLAAAATAVGVWQTPVNLGANVNTANNEWYPVMTADGWTMIFVSDRPGGYGSTDFYRSNRSSSGWSPPVNMGPNVNSAATDSGQFITADGGRMYFASNCDGSLGSLDLWYAPLTNGQAGAKVHLPAPINTADLDCCPVVTADGNTMYFSSDRAGGYGNDDIYVTTFSGGAWSTPVNLGATVNSSGAECARWLSADGNTLLFISWRDGGQGECDLWTTTRTAGVWGAPVNLGANVNTAANEWGASFRCNNGAVGGIIYYGSGRAGGYGGMDLWQATDDASYEVEPTSLGRVKAGFQ